MIEYIQGILKEKKPVEAIIENNGKGYHCHTTLETYKKLPQVEEKTTLYTHLIFKEDYIHLYGFFDKKERMLFLQLISVSGIGPKIALAILSSISPQDLNLAIKQENIKKISTIPGIGKKTAARLVIELKDKLQKLFIEADEEQTGKSNENFQFSHKSEEAILALTSLGIQPSKAETLVNKIINSDENLSTEDIIKKALAS